MKCFLTSSPMLPYTEALNPANGFVERLRACMPGIRHAVFVSADPDDPARTERIAASTERCFAASGFFFGRFSILDGRNPGQAAALIGGADFVILGGGHVPTQNRFFQKIGLKEVLRGYDGVVLGISAGSMNAAEVVYAQPERPGEAVDPAFRRFLPGLGLTQKMLIPHYQMVKNDVLDGLRVMEDVAYPDSAGRRFYVLVDGSYLFIDNGKEEIFGEAYLLADGELTRLAAHGSSL